MDKIEVKVGQTWEDNDPRQQKQGVAVRRIKVLEIADGKALCQHPSGLGRKTKIRLDRFRATKSGYKFISE